MYLRLGSLIYNLFLCPLLVLSIPSCIRAYNSNNNINNNNNSNNNKEKQQLLLQLAYQLNLLKPFLHRLEGVLSGDVKDDNDALHIAVQRLDQGTDVLVTRCVPAWYGMKKQKVEVI